MNIIAIIPLFFGMRGWQLVIVLLLILLLFGAKRIPTLMKSLGKSVHSFKQGMAEAEAEMKKPIKTPEADESEKRPVQSTAKDTEE